MEQTKKASALKAAVAAALAAVAIAVCAALPQSAWAATEVSPEQDLQAALNEGGEITLVGEGQFAGDYVIPEGNTVVLNLNNHAVTNKSGHTILNKGNLTIVGPGSVMNDASERQAVYNDAGATVVLDGGKYSKASTHGYVLLNHGTMTINSGVSVTTWSETHSALVENGWANGVNGNPEGNIAKMTINGGSFVGGGSVSGPSTTIKNDEYGTLVINDGYFQNDARPAVMNWNIATINDGEFEVGADAPGVISASHYGNQNNTAIGKLTINNGTFKASSNTAPIFCYGKGSDAGGSTNIAGGDYSGAVILPAGMPSEPAVSAGTFTDANVAKYLASDAAALKKADGSISVADEDTIKNQAAASVTVTKDGVSTTTYYEDKAEAEEAKKEAVAAGAQVEEKVFKCTVTFDYGTGEKATAVVENGGVVAKPADPTYEGWKFVGWFSDADFKNAYDFATPVTGDITIYAGWNEVPAPSTDEPAATADVKKSSSAKTGDTNLFVPVAAVAGIAAAVALGAVAYRRKMQ